MVDTAAVLDWMLVVVTITGGGGGDCDVPALHARTGTELRNGGVTG